MPQQKMTRAEWEAAMDARQNGILEHIATVNALRLHDPDHYWAPAVVTRTLHEREFNGDYYEVTIENAIGQMIGHGYSDDEALADIARRRAEFEASASS